MPSITETMRSTVPEATGKKDLRAEKTSAPAPESQNVLAPGASMWTRVARGATYSVMSISLLVAACACASFSRALAASIFSSACSAASVAAFISACSAAALSSVAQMGTSPATDPSSSRSGLPNAWAARRTRPRPRSTAATRSIAIPRQRICAGRSGTGSRWKSRITRTRCSNRKAGPLTDIPRPVSPERTAS